MSKSPIRHFLEPTNSNIAIYVDFLVRIRLSLGVSDVHLTVVVTSDLTAAGTNPERDTLT